MKLDKVDLDIIRILSNDGRTPNNELATELGVADGTIRNRLIKLRQSGFFRVIGQTNPDLDSTKRIIFLGIKIAVSKNLVSAGKKISELPYVQAVSLVTGRYDILAELFISPAELITFLDAELSRIDSVTSTESYLTLKNFKKWVQ